MEGWLAIMSFVLLGFLSAQLKYSLQEPAFTQVETKDIEKYYATILSKPINTPKTTKYEVQIKTVYINNQWINYDGMAIVYFVSKNHEGLAYGTNVLVNGNLAFIKKQSNPHAFDYSKYLQRRGIYMQDFIYDEDFVASGTDYGYIIDYYSVLSGDYFEKIISTFIPSGKELNMIKAMIIGRREGITSEMEYVYQATGTSHILAVSRPHVGIIFLILSRGLWGIKTKRFKWLYYGSILFSIWAFAFITGSSPSVLRASLMISIFLLAEIISRKSNIYNSILVSAFALLLYDPNLLFSVSFQLSYAAVFGIIYLYNSIYKLIFIKNKVINFFWQITVLSLSAQIATFPITIYYFHQFPTLALLTNLMAIPTAMIVIVGSLLLFITSPFGIIPEIIAYLLEGWVFFYNLTMSYISKFEFATIEGLYIKPYFVFLMIICVILIVRFLETRKLHFMRAFTFTIIFISALAFFDFYQKSNQNLLVVYDVQRKSYNDIFVGMDCYTNIKASELNGLDVHFNVIPNRKYNLIKKIDPLGNHGFSRLIGDNTLYYHGNTSILFLEELKSLSKQSSKVFIDYLVISKNATQDIQFIKENFHFETIILDASITTALLATIEKTIGNTSKIHSVVKDGAYIASI